LRACRAASCSRSDFADGWMRIISCDPRAALKSARGARGLSSLRRDGRAHRIVNGLMLAAV